MKSQNKGKIFPTNMLHKKGLPITLDKGNNNRVSSKPNPELQKLFNSFTNTYGFNKPEGGAK